MRVRVLLVGNGGRETALAWRLAQSETLTELWTCRDHPGWPSGTQVCVADDNATIVTQARAIAADLVVVGPEGPLTAGLADALGDAGIPCFGPTAEAARLEGSKAFTKAICEAAGVETAHALVVDRRSPTDLARAEARCAQGDVVIKADGLASGKGVIVCRTPAEATVALAAMGRFGAAADRLVLEDRLEGPEVSVFALCDGTRAVALPSAQDHKQLLDGGHGPNTGGMGAYAPCPLVDPSQARHLVATVHQPVIDVLAQRGHPFRGVLYAGFMLTAQGPRLLEFNVRFGDPECQALMASWRGDLLPWLHGAAIGQLPAGEPPPPRGAACCVVLASEGYPDTPRMGDPIPRPDPSPDVVVFLAGAEEHDGGLRTSGGRVLGITGVGASLQAARNHAYEALPGWCFRGATWRRDIGAPPASVDPRSTTT